MILIGSLPSYLLKLQFADLGSLAQSRTVPNQLFSGFNYLKIAGAFGDFPLNPNQGITSPSFIPVALLNFIFPKFYKRLLNKIRKICKRPYQISSKVNKLKRIKRIVSVFGFSLIFNYLFKSFLLNGTRGQMIRVCSICSLNLGHV